MEPPATMDPAPASAGPHLPRPPWSVAAISAFVCSLLGCIGITAILGFILGVVGILGTRHGRKRGMGLAIAAIPISLLTGTISLFLVALLSLSYQFQTAVATLPGMLADGDGRTTWFASRASMELAEAVTPEVFSAWADRIAEKHGTLATSDQSQLKDSSSTPSDGFVGFSYTGDFENGPARIRMRFVLDGFRIKLGDIEIAGVSPRRVE